MPGFVKTAKDEKKWKRAKQAVASSRKKSESEFDDQDWGLANKIFHKMKKSLSDAIFSAKSLLK